MHSAFWWVAKVRPHKVVWKIAQLRASPLVLSMSPCKIISHIQVQLFTCLQPYPKAYLAGTAKRWELLRGSHLDQSKTGSRSQNIFITLFCSRCTALLRFLPAKWANRANMQEKNYFPDRNRHMLTCLHPILMCRVTYWAPVGML
jgi:hypothetical protein